MGASSKMEMDIKVLGESFSGEIDRVEQNVGFKVGYQKININAIGFSAALNQNDYKLTSEGESDTVTATRLDGNITYGLSEQGYVYGGVNYNKFTSGDGADDFDAELGFQIGGGVAINKNFALDLNYYQANNSASEDGISVDLETSGLELGVNLIF